MKLRVMLIGVLLFVSIPVLLLFMRRGSQPASSVEEPTTAQTNPTQEPFAALKARQAKSAPPAEHAVEEMNHLQVVVHDARGLPLEGAEVRSSVRSARGEPSLTNYNGTFKTTAQGIADVLWPRAKMSSFKITASKDDFAPRQMTWDLVAGDSIPPLYTVTLMNGIRLGGFVFDPEGNPVAAANVSLYRFWSGNDPMPSKGEDAGFSRVKLTTDSNGRWQARGVPGDLLKNISAEISHEDFLGTNFTVGRVPEIEAALRAGTHHVVLQRGLLVRGRVIDESEQPITNAQVWAGRKYSRERKETRSDAAGRFAFKNISEGDALFAVMAEGFAPDSKSHRVDAASEELVFRLGKGAVIRGVVQNGDAEPLKGVRVVLEGSPGDEAYDRYEFSTTTGADGRFEWKSAPNKPMPFYFGTADYEQKRNVRLKPNEENIVTLNRNRVIDGHVFDADTGQPVKRFKVLPGQSVGQNSLSGYSSSDAREFSSDEGRFTMELHEQRSAAIEVSAQGYFERIEALPKAEGGRIEMTIQLKPSKPLDGVVMTPEGQPVAGATVVISESGGQRGVTFAKGELRANGRGRSPVKSDAAGKFSISPAPEEGTVVAALSNSFGSATVPQVRASGAVILQGFGRIEGVVIRAGGPASGQELLLSAPSGSGLYFEFESYKTAADAEGRFAFENVPPGNQSIVRLVKTAERSWTHSHKTDVTVLPGQTTSVTLGGTEATLQGRVRFESDPPKGEYNLSAQLTTRSPAVPPDFTPAQRTAFFSSPEWRQHISERKNYFAVVNPDGSVVIDSVAPGQYSLRVTATESKGDGFIRKMLAQGETTITVPEGASPNVPIDVGEVLVKVIKPNPPSYE